MFWPFNLGELKKAVVKTAFVPWEGIEPSLPKELDFESSASTSSATKAYKYCDGKGIYFIEK